MAIVGLSERLYCDVRFLNDGVRMRSRWFFRCLIRFIRFVKPFRSVYVTVEIFLDFLLSVIKSEV